MSFENGDKVFIGSRFVGLWVGLNPITDSHVVYKDCDNEYKAFHGWQIKPYPEVSVKAEHPLNTK